MKLHRLVVACLVASLLSGCASDELAPASGLADPGLSNVRTENAAARSASISEAGGTLSVTGGNGAVYTLTIPAEALDSAVTIAMYPIESIAGLPISSSLRGGVHLAPEGFAPNVPITLTIDLPSEPDPKALATIASVGNAESAHPFPSMIEGRRLTLKLTHFSQYATGDATLDALIDMPVSSSSAQSFQTTLAFDYYLWRRDGVNPNQKYVATMSQWWTQYLLPKVNDFITTSFYETIVSKRPDLVKDFNAWLAGIDFCTATAQGPIDLGSPIGHTARMATALRHGVVVAINEINRIAGSDPNGPTDAEFAAMINPAGIALALQFQARLWNFDSKENDLDKETVLRDLPLKVVIDSRTLPSGFAPGSSGTLDIHAGVSYAGRPVRFSVPVDIRLFSVAPSSVSPATGRTDATGHFRPTVQWSSGELKIDMIAFLRHGGGERYSVSVFDRLTMGEPRPIPVSWRSMLHEYRWGDGSRETAGIHINLFGDKLHAYKVLSNGALQYLYVVTVTKTDRHFTGTEDIPLDKFQYVLRGWTVIVSGDILDDNRLDFSWNAAERDGPGSVEGSEVIGPF
jgi:hypothetical protein